MNNPHRPPAGGRSVLQARPAWLPACLAAGVLAGVPGSVVFGSLRGYLAVLLALALGWLLAAGPTQCSAPPAPPSGQDAKRGSGP